MFNRRFLPAGIVFIVAAVSLAGQAGAEVVLKQEPPMGQLREGQIVLVDDGSCPPGQIKEVTGGNHVAAGGFKHILRTHRCIPFQGEDRTGRSAKKPETAPPPSASPRPAAAPAAQPPAAQPAAAAAPERPADHAAPLSPATAERRVALVIGNSNYSAFPKIPNAHNDAEDLAGELRGLGFDVLLGTDLKRADMEDLLIRFAKAARASDTALVFYAGHGLQHLGVNYLAPIDAKIDDETDLRKLVNVQDVISDLQSAGHVRILIVDACRDNKVMEELSSKLPATRSAAFTRGLARISAADGTLIAFATQPNRVAEDGAGRNSPFTTALLKNLPTPGLELRTLLTRVRAEVVAATDGTQRPEVWDSLVGEFTFKGE
jgi:Caspase domain